MNLNLPRIIFYIFLIIIFNSNALDNPHFYKASQFYYKPRLAEDGLLSINGYANWGGGDTGYDEERHLVPLLSIWGTQNMNLIADGIPESILDKFPNSILNDLWQKNSRCPFGQLYFSGTFKMISADLDIEKNGYDGFFFHIRLPVRRLQIYDIKVIDNSTESSAGPDINFKEWTTFISNFESNMNRYGLCLSKQNTNQGFGDLTFTFGKTINYERTKRLDFVDATFQLGVLFPTGKAANPFDPFELPTGYNKHFGLPIASSFSIGMFEWLTIGSYLNLIIFKSKDKCVGMKTATCQNGPIKLAFGEAKVKRGPLLTYGFFIEADHITRGFSFLFGYQLNNQSSTELCPFDKSIFNMAIVNSDSMLQGWQMSTINFILEYDFADFEYPNRPKIGLTLDLTAKGKQIFRTKIGGFYIGADISCEF